MKTLILCVSVLLSLTGCDKSYQEMREIDKYCSRYGDVYVGNSKNETVKECKDVLKGEKWGIGAKYDYKKEYNGEKYCRKVYLDKLENYTEYSKCVENYTK